MRELKFRVVVNGKVAGEMKTDPTINGGAWFFLDYSIPYEDRICDFCGSKPMPPVIPFLGRAEYEQFTGLYDRNGREIYEGDIIKDDYYHRPIVVEWIENGFWLRGDDGLLTFPYSEYMQVIGNIHENQELIP